MSAAKILQQYLAAFFAGSQLYDARSFAVNFVTWQALQLLNGFVMLHMLSSALGLAAIVTPIFQLSSSTGDS